MKKMGTSLIEKKISSGIQKQQQNFDKQSDENSMKTLSRWSLQETALSNTNAEKKLQACYGQSHRLHRLSWKCKAIQGS